MRKVEVSVYKFDELSDEVKEALIEGSRDQGISGEIESFIDSRLTQYGLKSLMVDDFSIGDDETEDYIKISGALSDSLSIWDKEEDFAELINQIDNCLLDDEDVDEDTNPFGLYVGGKDLDAEDQESAKQFIEEQLEIICDKIISETSEAMESFEADEEEIIKYLEGFEYLIDGTAFDGEEYIK